MKQGESRIAALDGWRGIAILLVLVSHLCLFDGNHHVGFAPIGFCGVTIFFVLSGYLITGNLIDKPDLKVFYIRRLFRLMPAAWVFLAVMATFHLAQPHDLLASLLFYRNFLGFTSLIHFWSLSVEEQFYLVWPCILILLGIRNAKIFAYVFGSICSLWALVICLSGGMTYLRSYHTQYQAEFLLLGCILGMRRGKVWGPTFGWLGWMGRISYSLYLWQQPVMMYHSTGILAAAIKVAVVFTLASFSYYFIEQPMIKMGSRIARPNSPHPECSTSRRQSSPCLGLR